MICRWIEEEKTAVLWMVGWERGGLKWPLTAAALDREMAVRQAEQEAKAFVALDRKGEPAGFFCCSPWGKRSLELRFLLVPPERRGQGVGGRIVRLAQAYARSAGAGGLYATAFESDPAIAACLTAAGFREIARSQPSFSFRGEPWRRVRMRWKAKE